MVKYGRKIGYLRSAIDRWVEGRARACKSTSDPTEPVGSKGRTTTQRHRRASGLTMPPKRRDRSPLAGPRPLLAQTCRRQTVYALRMYAPAAPAHATLA